MNLKYILFLISLIAVIYVAIENNLMLCVRKEKFGKGIKIAHISDLHKRKFGVDNYKISDKVGEKSPDLIVVSGDIVSRDEKEFSAVENLLRRLSKIAPVYMINGNHENSLPEDIYLDFEAMISRTNVKILSNKCEDVNINGRNLKIYGFEPSETTYIKNERYKNLDKITLSDMNETIGKCPSGEVLLIAHNPLFGEVYSQWGADFTFSGHVHGGAVRIPFTKIGVLSPERKFFPKYSKGVYNIGKMRLLVSAGLGKLRLFNPPEIVFYEI